MTVIAPPEARGRGERLVDAGDRVVVGQREQLDARVERAGDDLRGREHAVARGRMGLEIERGRADRRQLTGPPRACAAGPWSRS